MWGRRGGALQWLLIIERVCPLGQRGVGGCRGCSGNEVMTVINSKVSCLIEHHGATSGYCVVLNDV